MKKLNSLSIGFHLFSKELKSLFFSKLAWSILAILQIIISFQFLVFIEKFLAAQTQQNSALNVTDMIIVPLYGGIAISLLFISPILTMKQISGEHKNNTMSLLLSSPIPSSVIVIAKYMAICCFLSFCIFVLSLMPISLILGANIDLVQVSAAIFGVLLCTFSFVALGFYLSSITRHPSIAASSSLGILLMLWLIGQTTINDSFNLLAYFSPLQHLHYFILGNIQTEHIGFFVLFSTYFISLTINKLAP